MPEVKEVDLQWARNNYHVLEDKAQDEFKLKTNFAPYDWYKELDKELKKEYQMLNLKT